MFEAGNDEDDEIARSDGPTGSDATGPGEPSEGESGGPGRAEVHRLVDLVLDADSNDPGSSLAEAIVAHSKLTNVVDGHLLAVLPGWEQSGDWANDGSTSSVAWLVNHTARTRASSGMLRKTGLLAATMPAVAEAASAGLLPLSHVYLLTRARKEEVADLFDRDIGRLVEEAKTMTADALKAMLTRWYYAALQEAGRNEPEKDPDPHGDRDTLTISTTYGDRAILRGEYSAIPAAVVIESIDAEIDSWFRDGRLEGDTRTRDELRADAHIEIIKRGAIANTSHHGPRPLIQAHIGLGDLFNQAQTPDTDRLTQRTEILNGGPVAATAVRDLLCDADLALTITDDDHHQPLYTGRANRNSTAAQHRALTLRAKGTCEVPGCDRPHQWCHDHHIAWWEHGGTTDINNLTMICSYHHKAIHHRRLKAKQGPKSVEFTTPDGQPIKYPYRNTG